MTKHLPRRTFLRGAGVAMALPVLDCMSPLFAASGGSVTRRMVAINFELSFHPPNLMPTRSGRDYELTPYLKPLNDLRERLHHHLGCVAPRSRWRTRCVDVLAYGGASPGCGEFQKLNFHGPVGGEENRLANSICFPLARRWRNLRLVPRRENSRQFLPRATFREHVS